jgi:hypothetical protein
MRRSGTRREVAPEDVADLIRLAVRVASQADLEEAVPALAMFRLRALNLEAATLGVVRGLS